MLGHKDARTTLKHYVLSEVRANVTEGIFYPPIEFRGGENFATPAVYAARVKVCPAHRRHASPGPSSSILSTVMMRAAR